MKPFSTAWIALAASLAGCQTIDEMGTTSLGQTKLRTADGTPAGTARLIASGSDVNVTITLSGLSPGTHGVHLHMTGSCTPPDFTSAGGHLNPGGQAHGFDNPRGVHLGDLPNAVVGPAGDGSVSFTLRGTAQEVLPQIFDADGTAVVVHATADDYQTDPAGNSGARLACGVLERG